jgi:hypothetical protein
LSLILVYHCLIPVFAPAVIYQYRRYRTLKGDSSMVRERKDFYQLKKAVGEDPVPEAEVAPAAADATGATDAAPVAPGAPADPAPKRKKKKAKRARSASEVEVDVEVEEDSGVPETTSVSPTTAREEVISDWFCCNVHLLCTGTNTCIVYQTGEGAPEAAEGVSRRVR